ncbi:hypothetical protein LINPERPRIM_LOCUS8826, partial [Linum perenne]
MYFLMKLAGDEGDEGESQEDLIEDEGDVGSDRACSDFFFRNKVFFWVVFRIPNYKRGSVI